MTHSIRINLKWLVPVVLSFLGQPYQNSAIAQTLPRMLDAVSSSILMAHVRTLEHAGGTYNRVMFTAGYDSAAHYVQKVLQSYRALSKVGFDTFYIPTAVPPYNMQPVFNVSATLEGKRDPSKVLIIGAHLDACAPRDTTWQTRWNMVRAPGADDNASGVAGVLEAARVLSDTAFHWNNDCTIQLWMFGGEEVVPVYTGWTYGSLHAAEQLKQSGKTVIGAICLDMIGYNSNYDYAAVVSNTQSEWIGRACLDANSTYGLGLIMNSPPFPSHEYSDHASFWSSSMPAILLIENYLPTVENQYYAKNTLYHSSNDTSGSLNPDLMARITRLTVATAAQLVTISAASVVHLHQPVSSRLLRAYPNPFNASTILEYSVDQEGPVVLEIVDVLGRLVNRLIDGVKPAGMYTERWDAGRLAGGIYFCRIRTGSHNGMIKLLLQK